MKWAVLTAGVAFFVIALGWSMGWGIGTTAIVLTIAGTAATMAVGLDRVS